MDADNGLRLDYEQTTQLLRTLVDVRFKLLAFVPTITGAAVGLIGQPRPAAELLGVGMLGLVATLGILVYELRNTQLHDALVHRAAELERQLGLRSVLGSSGPGGLFAELPGRTVRLLGVFPISQDRGLALVYSAALGGWTYLAAWGALGAVELGDARALGAAIGVAAGILVLVEVERVHRCSDEKRAPARRHPPG
jgi:hypothetical protein